MNLIQDLRYAFRLLLKSPGFSLVVISALAAGIGVNTAVFTMVNAVLFKGLPFERPDEIMHLTSNQLSKGREGVGVSYPDFQDWRAQSKTFRELAAFQTYDVNLTDAPAGPERFSGSRLSSNVFSLIGQRPMVGRDFLPDEEKPGAPPVVIVGYSVWKNRYGGDPAILGRTIRLNETATTVIGVMPEGFRFPVRQDLWTPLVVTAEVAKRDHRILNVFGRLAPGVSLPAARAEMDLIAKRLEKEYGATNQGIGIVVRTYNSAFNGGNVRNVFLAMLGAVGFVLLIACANVANLQLSRAMARLREVSIRSALGASRWRIIRQLLIESVLLGVIGGMVGLALAVGGVRAFDLALANVGKPYWIRFTMDYTVFGYLAAVCIGAGILSGLLPALAASKVDLNTTLKEGGRGSAGSGRGQWVSGALVTAEFALSMILLVSAGLMMRSLLKSYDVVTRFDLDHTMVARVSMPESLWKKTEARTQFWDRLMPRLRAVPGAGTVAFASTLPAAGAGGWRIELEGHPLAGKDLGQAVSGLIVSPGYFDALQIRLQRGRDFRDDDGGTGKEALIVNQRFAAQFFPREDPIGRRVRMIRDEPQPWMTIVGVCEDIEQDARAVDREAVAYVPYRQEPSESLMVVAHGNVNASALVPAMRVAVHEYDRELSIFSAQSLRELYDEVRWPFRVFGTLFVVFAAIALVLSAVGIFSVVAYNVSRRTQEIGLRMALGASGVSILRLVLRNALRQLAIGAVLGVAGAYGSSRLIQSILLRVSATDLTTFVTVVGILLAVGLFACWLPARRAAAVDPIEALRYE